MLNVNIVSIVGVVNKKNKKNKKVLGDSRHQIQLYFKLPRVTERSYLHLPILFVLI